MYILDTRRDRVCTLNCGASYIEDESRHWDLSSDVIKFSYWHIKGFFKATFDQKRLFFESLLYDSLQTTPFHTD